MFPSIVLPLRVILLSLYEPDISLSLKPNLDGVFAYSNPLGWSGQSGFRSWVLDAPAGISIREECLCHEFSYPERLNIYRGIHLTGLGTTSCGLAFCP